MMFKKMIEKSMGMSFRPSRDYERSIEYLYGLQKYGIKLGLKSTERLLDGIGNPHMGLRCIHVGGTNGKGSTCAMLSSLLSRHGLRVGLYTSPHLVRFTERFRIDDREVSPRRIVALLDVIRSRMNSLESPTYFEMVTAMAMLYFSQEKVDVAIMEVGMGGRLDATNVIMPLVSVITSVSRDHEEYLGTSLSAIAREKAGIIKKETPLVTAMQKKAVYSVLKASCWKMQAPMYRLGRDFHVKPGMEGTLNYKGIRHEWETLPVGLRGEHQQGNAALALCVLELLEAGGLVRPEFGALKEGLQRVEWPARLEVVQENPLMVLDGAHNAQGADALRTALSRDFNYGKLHLVMGIMNDKDIRGIFKKLLPIAHTAVFTRPAYDRSADPEFLKKLAGSYGVKHYVIPDVEAALEQARQLADKDDLICITGSLYFVGEVKAMLERTGIF